MNDLTPQQPAPASKPKRPSRSKKPKLAGEITYIAVPTPVAASLNKDRPANALIMAQVEHMHQAEKNRLPKHRVSGKHPGEKYTEAEAAAYIRHVTALLHPLSKKKKAAPKDA